MAPKIQKFDRRDGTETTEDFWPALARLAELTETPRDTVLTILLAGQDFWTCGFTYRLLASEGVKVREAIREIAYDRIAMAN